tara:strand:+ start:5908 stop:6627 length:720 start_codon:yes stop_codon:yes gene_type:complete
MNALIIIPTYNEIQNIPILIDRIKELKSSINLEILIIDDGSPDGTAELIEKKQENDPKLHLINRGTKLGLGSAYCLGFNWAIKNKFNFIIQMDADLSHNPDDILRLLNKINDNDIVIGSRYKTGVNVVNWPLRRLILSYLANIYARIITGVKVYDLTSGFKCIKTEVLKNIGIDKIKSEGYSFQIEVNCLCHNKGYKIFEIPIIFYDRTIGQSKMSKKIIFEAIIRVPIFRLKRILGIS